MNAKSDFERVNENDFVISGISGRYPESDNIEEFWNNLINGYELYTSDDRRWP
ncbi:fatty acid synthase-like protein, partial [Dinothrombium tinctorium]